MGGGIRAQRRRLQRLWDSVEERYGLLSEHEAAVLSSPLSPGEAGLLAVVRNGVARFPGFQFSDGSTRPEWRELAEPLLQAGWSSEDVLLWFAAPTGWLDGRVPADLLDADVAAVKVAVASVAPGSAQ